MTTTEKIKKIKKTSDDPRIKNIKLIVDNDNKK